MKYFLRGWTAVFGTIALGFFVFATWKTYDAYERAVDNLGDYVAIGFIVPLFLLLCAVMPSAIFNLFESVGTDDDAVR